MRVVNRFLSDHNTIQWILQTQIARESLIKVGYISKITNNNICLGFYLVQILQHN